MGSSMVRETGCTVLAEGIESESELNALRGLGVALGQGYLLGRPVPIGEIPATQIDDPKTISTGRDSTEDVQAA